MEKIAAFWFGPFLVLLLQIIGSTVISSVSLSQDLRLYVNSKSFPLPKLNIHLQFDPDDVYILKEMNKKIKHLKGEIYGLPEREEILKRFGLGIDNILRRRVLTPEHLHKLQHVGEEIAEIIQEIESLPKKNEVVMKIDKGIDELMDKLLAGIPIEGPLNEDISVLETFLEQIKPNQYGEVIVNEDFPKIRHLVNEILDEIEKLGAIMIKKGHMENGVFKPEFTIKIEEGEKGKMFLRIFAKEIGELINEIEHIKNDEHWSYAQTQRKSCVRRFQRICCRLSLTRNRRDERSDLEKEYRRMYLYSFIRPLLLLGALFGVFPLSKFYRREGPLKFRYCSLLYGYAVFVVLCFVVLSGVIFISIVYQLRTLLNEFVIVMEFFFEVLTLFGSFLCIIVTFTSHSKLGNIYDILKELDELLPTTKAKSKIVKFCGWIFSILIFLLVITKLLSQFYMGTFGNPKTFSFFFISLFVLIVLAIAVTLYTFFHAAALSLCISQLYYNFNQNLMSLLPTVLSVPTKERYPKIQATLGNIHLLKDLEYFRFLHYKIYRLSQDVSDYFSLELFVVISTQFLSVCYSLFQGLASLKVSMDAQATLFNFLLLSINLGSVIILSYSVDVSNSENKKILENLCLYKTLPSEVDQLTTVLSRFSQQVYHFEPTMDVVGFFSISRGFFISMLGTIVTYVIILIQFADEDNISTLSQKKHNETQFH